MDDKDYIKLLENSLMESIDNMAQLSKKFNQDFDYHDYTCKLGMRNSQALDFLDLFSDDTMYINAKKSYLELKNKIENYNGSLADLCEELKGDLYDTNGGEEYDECFRADFGSICIAILKKDGIMFLDKVVSVYDRFDNKCDEISAKDLLEEGDE